MLPAPFPAFAGTGSGEGAQRRAAVAHDRLDAVRVRRIGALVGRRGARHRRVLEGAISHAVVVEGSRTPRAVGVLQPVGRIGPERLVVGGGDVVPDVGEVEIVGARVRALDQLGGAVVDAGEVEFVVLRVGVPVGQAVAGELSTVSNHASVR